MQTNRTCAACQQPLSDELPMGLCPQCLIKSGFLSGTEQPDGAGRTASPSIEELAPLFPQLEILELIGRGGMGAVYKARQPLLNRLVALKILARGRDGDGRFAERFQREAQALARMSHPNIVTIYDFGETEGRFYLIMEYVDGLNLRQLERASKLTPEQALTIVPPICDALQYAHKQGIVHRDIKPENILVDKSGNVKIADFGIAKILGVNADEPLTGEHHAVGTPHYMAPEQLEKPTTVDHRADIYSLGVVFYEMLTGELPIGRFAAPSKKVQIDVRLDEIVMRALEKEPELRYQHVSDVRTQVETVMNMSPAIPKESRPVIWPYLVAVVGIIYWALPPFIPALDALFQDERWAKPLFWLVVLFPAIAAITSHWGRTSTAKSDETLHSRSPLQQSPVEVSIWPRALAMSATILYFPLVLGVVFSQILQTGDRWRLIANGLMFLILPLIVYLSHTELTREADRKTPSVWPKIVGWLAWILAVPVMSFAVFFLFAMMSERDGIFGWHPSGREAADVLLTMLGAIVLPLSGWVLLRRVRSKLHASEDRNAPWNHAAVAAGFSPFKSVFGKGRSSCTGCWFGTLIFLFLAVLVALGLFGLVWREHPVNRMIVKQSHAFGTEFQYTLFEIDAAKGDELVPSGRRVLQSRKPGSAIESDRIMADYAVIPRDTAKELLNSQITTPGLLLQNTRNVHNWPVGAALADTFALQNGTAIGGGTGFLGTRPMGSGIESRIEYRLDYSTPHSTSNLFNLVKANAYYEGPLLDVESVVFLVPMQRGLRHQYLVAIFEAKEINSAQASDSGTTGVVNNISSGSQTVVTHSGVNIGIFPVLLLVAALLTVFLLMIRSKNPLLRIIAWSILSILIILVVAAVFAKRSSMKVASERTQTIRSLKGLKLSKPPYEVRFSNGTVELLALDLHSTGSSAPWLPDGKRSTEPFPVKSSGLTTVASKVIMETAFRIRNQSDTASLPVVEIERSEPVQAIGSYSGPETSGPQASFVQLLACQPDALDTNLKIGIADGEWETVAKLETANLSDSYSSRSDANGNWEARFHAIRNAGSEVTISYGYSNQQLWETRMVAVKRDQSVLPLKSGSTQMVAGLANGIMAVPAAEFDLVSHISLQRRKYQWMEFRNVSLREGHGTNVEVVNADSMP